MQIYDGPINVQNCTFRKYIALEGRHSSAFGFRLNNSWQSCPNNNVTDITFDHVPVSHFLVNQTAVFAILMEIQTAVILPLSVKLIPFWIRQNFYYRSFIQRRATFYF